MAIITIENVLEHAEQFEQMLADYYANLSEKTNRDGVRLLTDYMSRHRIHIEAALQKIPASQVKQILSERVRYEPQGADMRTIEAFQLPPNATADQVLDAAITFDESLITLYNQVLQQTNDEQIRLFFESLLHAEERDEIELKKIKAMDYF